MIRFHTWHRLPPLLFGLFAAMAAVAGTPSSTPAPLPECPTGTHAVGKAPPAGLEWHCETATGVAEGPWLRWYDGGQLLSEGQMKNGREHGRQRGWWPNGQLMLEGISVDGNRYKGFKYWSFDGSPTDLGIKPDIVTQPGAEEQKASEQVAPQPAAPQIAPPQKNTPK